jgi:hypothetical protein
LWRAERLLPPYPTPLFGAVWFDRRCRLLTAWFAGTNAADGHCLRERKNIALIISFFAILSLWRACVLLFFCYVRAIQ